MATFESCLSQSHESGLGIVQEFTGNTAIVRWPQEFANRNGEQMTGNKHNPEGNSSAGGEPDPGPYSRRMHRDWRFWVGALFMAAAVAIYVLTGDLSWVPRSQPR